MTTNRKTASRQSDRPDILNPCAKTQTPEHATICNALRADVDAVLPNAIIGIDIVCARAIDEAFSRPEGS